MDEVTTSSMSSYKCVTGKATTYTSMYMVIIIGIINLFTNKYRQNKKELQLVKRLSATPEPIYAEVLTNHQTHPTLHRIDCYGICKAG